MRWTRPRHVPALRHRARAGRPPDDALFLLLRSMHRFLTAPQPEEPRTRAED
ncbi:hypothetical protein [Streptomyces sp. NPDC048172]|uniref:hypothetical protein n=1 Tax=Streptomyces sp. NPDC048172 TaxID=3365505 RepID=UPI00371C01B5